MPKRHLLNCLSISLIAAFSSGEAEALGFARANSAATLGAPLNFAVGVRTEAEENLNSDCVNAEVWVGETPLSRSNVSASLEGMPGARVVRVRTFVRIEEPVVTVAVTAGCEAKVSRRFTLFADPVGVTAGMQAPLPPVDPVMMGAAPSPSPMRAAQVRPPAVARASQKPEPKVAQARPRQERRVAAAGLPVAKPSAAKAQSIAAAAPVLRPSGNAPGARLRLDAPAVTYAADQIAAQAAAKREEALAAVRAAVGMAQAAANAASSRVTSMEASVEALKRESKANRDAMAKLQQSLSQSDERGRWTPYLLAALLGMLGLTGWMYSRVKRAESERQKQWWNSAHGALEASAKASDQETAAPRAPSVPTPPRASAPARPVVAAAQTKPPVMTPATGKLDEPTAGDRKTAHDLTPLPAGFVVPDTPQRDVKIEELLDVEQQAEFFVVLGQDEAAIDLLMGHLRSTGGASPLPYLKLLEIYHRRGDQTSYERTRRRFNDRFNAMAPEWSSGLHSGRSLQDYPDVMATIESTWARPAEAMSALEPLLFRTDAQDLFDLPAYRDVLFLFTLARDLKEMPHEAGGDNVDLFLPLAQGSTGFALTGPASLSPAPVSSDADNGLTFSLAPQDPSEPNEPQASAAPATGMDFSELPDLTDDVLTFKNTRG